MRWKDLVCLGVIVLGMALFLYGSNYYNGLVGWVGVYLIIGGTLAEITLQAYETFTRKRD
jgi:D-alanyl-lipoteichoic acid acyltransferase DltB (MBOAT superfamily)